MGLVKETARAALSLLALVSTAATLLVGCLTQKEMLCIRQSMLVLLGGGAGEAV